MLNALLSRKEIITAETQRRRENTYSASQRLSGEKTIIMETLDRTKEPKVKAFPDIHLPEAEHITLANGLPVHIINSGTQDVLKVEFLFSAGALKQPARLVAAMTIEAIGEGTDKLTSNEISEKLDFYGAYMKTDSSRDTPALVLYTLGKHLDKTLPVIKDLLLNASYPENELKTYRENSKQRLISSEKKVATLASKILYETLYGKDHPFGYRVFPEDFDTVTREQLLDFHHKHYRALDCDVIISGKVDEAAMNIFKKEFENIPARVSPFNNTTPPLQPAAEKKVVHEVPGVVQSSIKLARPLFSKKNPDYIPLQVLNTLFGGYFGSRLMANIREDKGYTYGIGSGLVALGTTGIWSISSEVGVDVSKATLKEIYHEMKVLREELVPQEELDTVKSYMLGVFLKDVDGPFALAEKYIGLLKYGLDYSYYQRWIKTVKNIAPAELQALANKYLHEEDFYEIVVGQLK